MSIRDVAGVLADRASRAGLVLTEPLSARLLVYYELLARWNRTINLTSLSNPEEAVDRLLLEPVSAASHLPAGVDLIDLGSGGGSPAVPLALALSSTRLVMVESRVRKAAFLREVLRELAIPGAVEAVRFEEVAARPAFAGAFDLVSVRAVRLDESTFEAIGALLRTGGQAALFRTEGAEDPPSGLRLPLQWVGTVPLVASSKSALTILHKA